MNAFTSWTIRAAIVVCLSVSATQPVFNEDSDIYTDMERPHSLCVMPEHPRHGRYWSVGQTDSEPGAAQPHLFLNTTCDAGYMAEGGVRGVFQCLNGHWLHGELPTCIRACKVKLSSSVEFQCVISLPNAEGTRACEKFEPEGTVMRPRCKQPSYYSITELPYMYCRDGSWDYEPVCHQECGRLTNGGVPLIVGGRDVPPGSVPWAVGIYYDDGISWNHKAGGNLVSRNAVVTVAHCFWVGRFNTRSSVERFAVAAGKRHRQWRHPLDDTREQASRVKYVHLSKNYYGAELYYQDDLAVLVLEEPFVYTQYVGPVCLNFEEGFVEKQLQPGNIGTTVGWGETSHQRGSEADTLQMLEMPYVPFDECVKRTSPHFTNYLVGGKKCAGYGNGTAPSRGDSGGGLTFPAEVLGVTRHYLQGVISTSPISRDYRVDLNALTSFEPVAKHAILIKNHWDPNL